MIKKVKNKIIWTFCILVYSFIESYSLDNQLHSTDGISTNLSTWSEKAVNCSPPGIEQFPKPRMGPEARKRGGLLLHLFICLFSFVGQAVVADYFVECLERICVELHLCSDVAGATFMAAGSSAPELATVAIGVLVNENDIGMSGVVGSAVFNITVVIAACSFVIGNDQAAPLNPRPILRESVVYAASVILTTVAISDGKITWYDSVSMILGYLAYCLFLLKKGKIETLGDQSLASSKCQRYHQWDKEVELHSSATPDESPNHRSPTMESGTNLTNKYFKRKKIQTGTCDTAIEPDCKYKQIVRFINFPISCMARVTMPDLSQEEYKNWYMYNFTMSLIWMAIYSYIMVWMITIIGYTLGIPDTVMGLTFIAAGISVPDALVSQAVAKEGYYAMAISNAMGSNIFDVLICLGVPWFLQTAVLKPGSTIVIRSKGLVYCTASLLSTVLFLVVSTHCHGWKLSKGYGMSLVVWYSIFIVFATLYESNNIVPDVNPPECLSSY